MPPTIAAAEHWPSMAAVWNQIGSPLRPIAEEIASFARLAQPAIANADSPQVLLLGVTPELYRLPWPPGRDFLAIDRTPGMIEKVWPGPAEEVRLADWRELPLPPASRDLVLCDGGLHLLDYPAGQTQLMARLAAVVRRGGRCVFRLFVLPPEREPAKTVMQDLFAGRISNLNQLKLRLAMALQETPTKGVAVQRIRETLRDSCADWLALASRLGWVLEHLRAIDAYRGSPARYHFLSLPAVIDLFCAGGEFRWVGQTTSAYPLGERCPLVAFART